MSPLEIATRNHAAALRALDNLQEARARYSSGGFEEMTAMALARYQATGRILLALLGEGSVSLPFTEASS